jgi:hypothetical protein
MNNVSAELIRDLTIGILVALLVVACAPQVFAQPTAANLAVADTSGDPGTYVIVPVTISNVQDGPIICIVCDLQFTSSVINVVGVQNGNLTSSWDSQYKAFTWGARFSLVYDGQTAHGLQNGSTGSIALLNLSVSGDPGETSLMQLTNIQLSDTAYNVGTASANNGIFLIPGSQTTPTPTPTPSPTEPPAEGGGGGEGAPPDTDGDGYPDQLEWVEGTDPNDPDDYPGKTEVRSLPRFPAIMPSVGTSSASPSVTSSPTSFIGSPAQARALKQTSFKALIAITGLVAVAYLLIRRKGLL